MAAADQNIAMMDGTYFVGRKEILDWVNGICATSLSKVEQTCTGAIACMILDSMYPGKVPMSKVDWSANKDYEYIQNYKVLQKCFTSLKLDKHIEVDRLIRGKYQDNLEFMQWFKKFYELNASGQPYDAIAQREKGKGGALYTSKFGGAAATASSPTPPARRKPGAATGSAGASRVAASKPPGAPVASTGARAGAAGTKSAVSATQRPAASSSAPAEPVAAANPELERELEELTGANETLTNENGELRLAVRLLLCVSVGRGERRLTDWDGGAGRRAREGTRLLLWQAARHRDPAAGHGGRRRDAARARHPADPVRDGGGVRCGRGRAAGRGNVSAVRVPACMACPPAAY